MSATFLSNVYKRFFYFLHLFTFFSLFYFHLNVYYIYCTYSTQYSTQYNAERVTTDDDQHPVCTCFGSRSLDVAAPAICNTLLLDIGNSPSMCCFRRHLKTFFYNLVFRPC